MSGRRLGGLNTHILDDPAAVARCAEDGERLPAPTGPMGGSAWIRAWLSEFAADYRLAVVVAGRPGSPEAVFPLVRHRRHPWFLETLGVRELVEPTDGRATSDAEFRPVAEELARRGLPLRLKRLPASSALIPHLRAAFDRRALVLSRSVAGTPTIALDATWRQPESHFSSRRRQDFRADRRHADRLGAVELSVEEPSTRKEAAELFDEFVGVEASGWKMRARTALASQPKMRAFYRSFCELAAEEKILRFGVLRIDGRLVAMQLAAEYDGRFNLFKIGYVEEFARCSPGTLLMLHTVGWAAERGLQSYELLGAEEPWTARWTTTVRPCVEVHVYPMSPWSVLAAGEVVLQIASRAMRTRMARIASAPRAPQGKG